MSVHSQAVVEAPSSNNEGLATVPNPTISSPPEPTVADDVDETLSSAGVGNKTETFSVTESPHPSDTPKPEISNRARQWFHSLDATEIYAAVGFVDAPFVEALCSVLPWSAPEGDSGEYHRVRLQNDCGVVV